LKGVRRVLYKLPSLIALQNSHEKTEDLVFICEGEKDVETLVKNGLIATCNPHGAGKWLDEYSKSFEGLNCVILPDNDDPGRKHAEQVANSIFGKALTVRVLELNGLPEKGDVTDWIEQGNSVDDLMQIAKTTKLWLPQTTLPTNNKISGFYFTNLNDLYSEPEEEIAYVLDKTLPVGGFSICSAKPKVGKSTNARNLAVCVSQGIPFLGRETLKGKVLYLCLEEKKGEVIKHFRRMNANTEDILIHFGSTPNNPLEELKIG
jgi:putative DNA primase/helicase